MTNYERICADKAFCAYVIAESIGDVSDESIVKWLDEEERELSQEVNHE